MSRSGEHDVVDELFAFAERRVDLLTNHLLLKRQLLPPGRLIDRHEQLAMVQLDDARMRGNLGADQFRPRDNNPCFLNLSGETQCGQTATNEVADRGRFRQDLPPEIDAIRPRRIALTHQFTRRSRDQQQLFPSERSRKALNYNVLCTRKRRGRPRLTSKNPIG